MQGGGMRNINGSPRLAHLIFTHNFAVNWGGGLYTSGQPTLIDVAFVGNLTSVIGFAGGGMCDEGAASLINARFIGNSSDRGGGLFSRNGTRLFNVVFRQNRAGFRGGGLHGGGTGTNVMFDRNEAQDGNGGGAAVENAVSLLLVNATFSGNSRVAGCLAVAADRLASPIASSGATPPPPGLPGGGLHRQHSP